ncbi:helix-turn-helix transcriptional regulator [Clostridium sp. SYSU_GA19001]|uniref:helix-turn-helix transcriptional regulator n=1 Tax=Clostridium caldaquaticum TaxID=2940653 RepID=UPI00207786FD|nr:helix-turn-helix transcriptional regulator [Clostridium caldaquaticum]
MFRIKEARQKAGLTQTQLAEKVMVTREYISLVENNHYKPSISLLERIAKELHTSVKSLIEDSA